MKFIHLYIDSIGANLRVKDQIFEVEIYKGKQLQKVEAYAAPQVKSIRLKRGTTLSIESIHLATKFEVDLLMEDQFGHPLARVVSPKPNSTTRILKAQVLASLDPTGLEYVKHWLTQKFREQQQFLAQSGKHYKSSLQEQIQSFVVLSNLKIERLAQLKNKDVRLLQQQIRGVEGELSKQYFQLLSAMLPKAYRFDQRNRRPAVDPFNAFLNYGYGILYNRVESSLFRAGLSPYIGFLHRDGYQFKSLVFDFIEPYRIAVDRAIFQLFSRKKIKKRCFGLENNGLQIKKDGKKLIADAFTEHFEHQKISYQGKQQTRQQIMRLEAQQLAGELKQKYFGTYS
ncbi:MAG: CRISPR-associated endonuclease Cas1 [Bacteroidota bacterium]